MRRQSDHLTAGRHLAVNDDALGGAVSGPAVNLRDWIGREQVREDRNAAAPLALLSATLDRDDPAPRERDPLPPFWRWLFVLPDTPMRHVGLDGHHRVGSFMPPAGPPRRMWAGSRLVSGRRRASAPRSGVASCRAHPSVAGRSLRPLIPHYTSSPRWSAHSRKRWWRRGAIP